MQTLLESVNDNFDIVFDLHSIAVFDVLLAVAIVKVSSLITGIRLESCFEVVKILIKVKFKSFKSRSAFSRVGHSHVLFTCSHLVEFSSITFTN